ITPLARKLELIAAHGAQAVVVEPFTRALASLSADAFVDDILVRSLGATAVVVGFDFTSGQKRRGTVGPLAAAGRERGVAVHVAPAVTVDGLVAWPTKIRELLLEGKAAGAKMLLGRAHDVDGPVMRGAGRGRGLGVPTANVAAEGGLLPRPGI